MDASVAAMGLSERSGGVGIDMDESCGWASGGRRTTGLLLSIGSGGREMADPVGDMISRPMSWTMDDRRLMAMLGE